MISNQVSAEFRKVFTTRLWWALLIPTVVLAFGWAWAWAQFGSLFASSLKNEPDLANSGFDQLPLAIFGLARSINISALFPMIFGGLAMASELGRRTITTTYLTAPSRAMALSAKAITYVALGALYGLVIVGVASLGILVGAPHSQLPSAQSWFTLCATGVLSTVLWTVLAVGVGALFGNAVATVLTLVLYATIVENPVALALPGHFSGFLINQSADGITSSVAAQEFLDRAGPIPAEVRDLITGAVRAAAGATGVFDWWLSALIFAAWTAIFFVAGWLISARRDIT